MDNTKVLIVACGFFGSYELVKNLQKEGYYIIGTDTNPETASKQYVDKFYEVPSGRSDRFIPKMFEICKAERPDVILPASSEVVYPLSLNKEHFEKLGIKVLVSEPETIEIANNKYLTYRRMLGHIPLPNFFYSSVGFCEKPMTGKGSRGVILTDARENFIMEKLEGQAIDVDVLSKDGQVLLTMMKTRDRTYGGTLVEGKLVSGMYLEKQVQKIVEILKLEYLSVIQFIGGKLLEVNSRIAGVNFYSQGWSMADLAIKLSLDQLSLEEVIKYQESVPYGKRISKTLIQYEY